jgi:dTDP-4-amino-4,6-dideoxygalactose transaminase
MAVPLFASSLEPYHDLLAERVQAVIRSGRYVLGPEVEAFEAEFAAYLGVEHCVGVANGTDALTIALRAAGVAPGDEVVLPSYTFYATAEAVVNAGAVPVFCDVEPATGCVTAGSVEAALGDRTRAIVPVHLFGNVAPVEPLRAFGLPVIEDAAQAAGAARDGRRAGALGDAATFSFFPSKNLPCLGDGGAIATDDEAIADRARQLRFHGSRDKSTFELVGYNSRLDELQAAALRVLLPELDGWNDARRGAAAAYAEHGLGGVADLELPHAEDGVRHVYHLYVARHPRADELVAALGEAGVGARRYYDIPVHRQAGMSGVGRVAGELPGTEEIARTNVALPMGTGLTEEQAEAVIAACQRV